MIKKALLDAETMKNYRPVSNLEYVAKLLEKVVVQQLSEYLQVNDLNEALQSAYKRYHSTETALLKVRNDLLKAVNNGKQCLLVLLDLSAAFDTIDHHLLLNRLQSEYGINGKALSWFSSYLADRTQRVYIKGTCSSDRNLQYGVPQGSVLGLILFTLYTEPISRIAMMHGIHHHKYADDTQLYIDFTPTAEEDQSRAEAWGRMERCIKDIKYWMAYSKLKLNDSKTEVLVVTSKAHAEINQNIPLKVGDTAIKPTVAARNLGIIFDNRLSLESHVAQLCKSAFFQIQKIYRIRKYLDMEATKTAVHSLVLNKLDYGNSQFLNAPKALISRMQKVQNAAARLIYRVPRREHITPYLKDLHWLKVEFRIKYKVMVLTYLSIVGKAPSYMTDMLEVKRISRPLRSENEIRLQENNLGMRPQQITKYGRMSFEQAAPTLWNSLPAEVRSAESVASFKSRLKTHYFKQCYELA